MAMQAGVQTYKVTDMRSSISQIGFDFQQINEMICGIEGKIESLESKQDVTLSGLWHLCQVAGVKDSTSTKVFQDVGARLPIDTKPSADNSLSGLRFLTEGEESVNVIQKPVLAKEIPLMVKPVEEKTKAVAAAARTRVHRAYPGGISWVRDVTGLS